MKYLLNTNTIVRYLNGRAPIVRIKLRATPLADLAVSAVVVAELRYGAAKSTNPTKAISVQDQLLSLIGLVPFDGSAVSRAYRSKIGNRCWYRAEPTCAGT